MKKVLLIYSTLLFATMCYAQESQDEPKAEIRTIFKSGTSHGGYGSLSVGYSQVDGRDAAVWGARGAWIINHGFAVGVGGNGFVTDFKTDPVYNTDAVLAGGYGGLLLEPIILPLFPVHISLPVLCGAGGIAYARKIDNESTDYEHNQHVDDATPFFFVKPGIEVELNLTKYMRLAMGGYYMYTNKIKLRNTGADALNSYNVQVALKFGKF